MEDLTMAIISPIFGEMRGKLGGNVFSRNKGGTYVKRHAIPTNPNTARQQATRNWTAWCSTAWESVLTEAQREQCREWAENNAWLNGLGQSIYLTGLNWYTMVNTRLLDCGGTPLAVPGDLSTPDPFLTATFTFATAASIAVAFTAVLPAGHRLVAWGSGPIIESRMPNFRQCRLIGYSAAAAASPVTLVLPYTVPVTLKLRCFFGVMGLNGRVSSYLMDEVVYTV